LYSTVQYVTLVLFCYSVQQKVGEMYNLMVGISQELNLIKELMAHNGKNYHRSSTLSRNSWLIMVRIISDTQPCEGTHGS
jgi:hypothetical protein